MKLKSIIVAFFLGICALLQAQTDSTRTLFKTIPGNIKLQWDIGFTEFLFKDANLLGTSTDFIGILYKDRVHISVGMEEATNNVYLNPFYNNSKTYTGTDDHAGYYIMAEPEFFHHKLFFITVPIKLMYVQNISGLKNNFNDNCTFAPGINAGINLVKNIALCVGANYRFNFNALFISSSVPGLSENDYSFMALLKITL